MSLMRLFQIGAIFALVFTSCASPPSLSGDVNADGKPDVAVTLGEIYLGVRDGNVESVSLPAENEYLTVEVCVKNISREFVTVFWRDVYVVGEDGAQYFPSALGLNQAEAFNWVLPLIEPIGGKHIEHKYYFFLIQQEALMTLPARQSQGCESSSQFTSQALLFILPKDVTRGRLQLLFLGGSIYLPQLPTSI
jgi:hypothetical protein